MTASAVIIIFAAIASLDILQIQAVSEPAKNMLNMIALAIPNVLAALLWLAIAFLIAKWVKSLIETVLPSLGFDNFVHSLGAMPRNISPSRVAGAIAMTALLLLAGIEALHRLGGDNTAALVIQVTELGGKVIFGTVIIVVGFVLARILAGLVGGATERHQLCRDHRQICDHRPVHRDRPDLHGAGRPDRDAGIRPDPWFGGSGDRDRLRPWRPRLCRAAAGGMA